MVFGCIFRCNSGVTLGQQLSVTDYIRLDRHLWGLEFVAGRPDARGPKTVASRTPHGGCRRFRVLEFDSVRFFVLSALALVFFGSELVLIALFAPVVSLLARAASYLPESFTFLEAYRNSGTTDPIVLGTVTNITLAFRLLVWALKCERYSVSIFSSLAFATNAGAHLQTSSLVILDQVPSMDSPGPLARPPMKNRLRLKA